MVSPCSYFWNDQVWYSGDVVPSIGLALQRAYHNSVATVHTEDVKVLEIFERKMFKFLALDNECIVLRNQIEAKISEDLSAIEKYVAGHCGLLIEATEFFNTYDNAVIQDKLFTEGGGDYAIEIFEQLKKWKENITG